jgi:hypothetical protein
MGAVSSIVLLIVTQCTGFGLAGTFWPATPRTPLTRDVVGMLQDILIKPTAMHWPATLVTVQLFTTLHDDRSKMTQKRLHIFMVVGTVCFFYQVMRFLGLRFAKTEDMPTSSCLASFSRRLPLSPHFVTSTTTPGFSGLSDQGITASACSTLA